MAYQACLAAAPDPPSAQSNLISLWIDTGRFADAERLCRRLITIAPQEAHLHTFLGAALKHPGQLLQVLEHACEAARLAPMESRLAENVGSGYARLGRYDEAWPHFARALVLQPQSRLARAARAYALLSCGRVEEGWNEYAFRPRPLRYPDIIPRFPSGEQLLEAASEERLFLLAEQGLGDELLFYGTCHGWCSDVAGTLVSVQRNPQTADMEILPAAALRPIHDASALNDDLEEMLALLSLIDDYVGVSNTNVHLRAGVGKAARVLVPGPAGGRWGVTGERSPWFPDFKVYRQALDGDWSAALATLAGDLRQAHGERKG